MAIKNWQDIPTNKIHAGALILHTRPLVRVSDHINPFFILFPYRHNL